MICWSCPRRSLESRNTTSGAFLRRLSRVSRMRPSARATFSIAAPSILLSKLVSAPSSLSHRARRASMRSAANFAIASIVGFYEYVAMKEESVNIPSGNLKLEALIAKPPGVVTSRGAVVCHPHPLYGGSMYNNVVEAILDALWKRNFATLRFNFRGVGASEGEHSGGLGEVDDAKAAMQFLLTQQGIANDRAVVAGYSFGAAMAMRAGVDL